MKKRRKAGLTPWSHLAMLTGEMMLASASVIHLRTGRMAKATYPLSAHDQKEFTRMVQEKVEAGREAAAALALASLSPGFMTTHTSASRVAKAMIKPFHSRATANARRLNTK